MVEHAKIMASTSYLAVSDLVGRLDLGRERINGALASLVKVGIQDWKAWSETTKGNQLHRYN